MRNALTLNKYANNAPCAYLPLFAVKSLHKVCTLLLLLCVSVVGWAATRYCGETVQSTGENTSISVNVTIQKLNETTTRIILDNEHITGLRDGGCFQQWSGGVWKNGDNAPGVADFEIGWTQSGNKWQKDFEWDTYPTTANIYFLMSLDNETSEPHGALFTLTDVDMSATCSAGGGEEPDPDSEPATINWNGVNWITGSNDKLKMVVSPAGPNIVNVQGRNSKDAIYVTYEGAAIFGECSLGASAYETQGTGVFFFTSNFWKQETEFTQFFNGTTYTYHVYNADGEPDDLAGWNIAKGKTAYAGHVAENGIAAANDGDKGTRWSSNGASHYAAVGESAGDWWYVDLGGFYQVNKVKILFETAAPTDYDLLISNNAVSWTVIGSYTTAPSTGNTDENYNVYNFTNKVGRYVKIFARQGYNNMAYGISMWEFEVYGARASISDVNPPVMGTASLSGDPLYNQVNIAVSATDTEDGTVGQFHVVDASKGVDQVCTAAAGVIAVTGLTEQTTYNFTITALDAAGNESENNLVVAVTTPADVTMPAVAAPVPSGTGKEILPVYCDAFTSILEHDFSKNGFDNPATLYQEKNIGGNKILVYDLSVGPKFVIWGMWNNEGDAIIAQSEYRAEGKMGIDASKMEYMHVDIWSLQACNSIWVNVNDEGPGALRLSHNGEGWQGFDIALSDITISGDADKQINNVRWLKFRDFGSVTGKLAFDNVYFWKTSTGLRSVSATPNNAEYGSASVVVKSSGLAPEGGVVADETEVTFSATPNDGYIFVNWSNGETHATFDATVDAAMNLTANFRALNHISCNEEMTNGDYTAYVTYKKTANDNEYSLIVRSAQEMVNFTNAYVGKINGNDQINLNGQGVLSGNGHMLSYTFTSTTEPKMNTPLYINFANHGEVTFNDVNNSTVFEFSQPCEDPEITAIALNKTSATLDMGNTLTLVPTFTPAYMSANIAWETSDDTKATVSNGVVTPVAAGEVIITAKVSETIKATCTVTVQESQAHNWYGYASDQGLDYTYRIEYTIDKHIVAHVKRQGEKTGLVTPFMNISNNLTDINVTEGEDEGWWKGTTAATYTFGDNIHILIQSNFSGASSIVEFDYEVGSDNVMPTILPSTLTLSNNNLMFGVGDPNIQLTAEIHHSDAANKTLTWASNDVAVATVENGLVHPVGVGTTIIRATTHNGISAECTVTVVGALEPTTYWGSGVSMGVSILYSITRNADHTLTYAVEALQNKTGFGVQVNDGEYHNATLNEGVYIWKSNATYTDGAIVSGFFYMPFSGEAARVDFNYTVGSDSEKGNMPIHLFETEDNTFMITESDEVVRDVTVGRSFAAGNLYTLVLPFNVEAEQRAEKLPGTLTRLNNTIVKENGDLRINFVDAEAIEAGVPYLYTPSANVANPVFAGVTVRKDLQPTEPADGYAKYYGIYAPTTGEWLKTQADAYVLGSDQYLYATSALKDEQTMKALRGYFVLKFPSGGGASGAPRARVVFNSHETEVATGVGNVQGDNEPCTKVLRDGQLLIIRDGRTFNAQGQLIQ